MKKVLCLILALLTCFVFFAGCVAEKPDDGGGQGGNTQPPGGGGEEKPDDKPVSNAFDGEYEIVSAIMNGKNITREFTMYTVVFRADGTMSVLAVRDGATTRRNSTYVYDGKAVLTETNGFSGEKHRYLKDVDGTFVTDFVDFDGTAEIVLAEKEEEVEETSVEFKSVLFGKSVSDVKIYNYCPAIIVDKDEKGNDVMHVWYCTNKDDGVIVDYVGYRVGVKQSDGKWSFGEEKIVLEPTDGTWDAQHTCDPAVIKGEFAYKGQQYSYLMAYLGCTTVDYQKNETGIAVAKDIGGPWVKIDEVNPIVPWYDDGDIEAEEAKYESYKGTSRIYWGTGMPALLSVDGKGEVILTYQSTLRGTGVRRIDLSDVEHPVVKYTVSISSNGIVNSQSQKCNIGIPDFAYDAANGRLYVVGVTNERNPADVTLTRVNSHSMVAYIDGLDSMEAVSDALQGGSYKWNMLGYVGPGETGWERNHNPGMVRNAFGEIVGGENVSVIVSTGHNSWPNENIFTYRLHGWTFPAPPAVEN